VRVRVRVNERSAKRRALASGGLEATSVNGLVDGATLGKERGDPCWRHDLMPSVAQRLIRHGEELLGSVGVERVVNHQVDVGREFQAEASGDGGGVRVAERFAANRFR
jgi:hypothetical protein